MLPTPSGWYCVGASRELPRRAVRALTFAGRDRVLFRTASGRVGLVDAYCPHLGAHMGHGGTVEGEDLRCPFHGFRFDCSGACTGTEYGTRTPRTSVASAEVDERDGLIFAWHGAAGEAPGWRLPSMWDASWSDVRVTAIPVPTHPQEIAENSVDVGHLRAVHGYESIESRAPLETEGPNLEARYTFRRPLVSARLPVRITADIDIHQWGLGCAFVDTRVREVGLRFRNYVLAMPVRDGETLLRIGLRVRQAESGPLSGGLGRVASAVLRDLSLPTYRHDVMQDVPIWTHKVYVDRPVLARGDGPIPEYRRWARQFYPEAAEAGVEEAAAE